MRFAICRMFGPEYARLSVTDQQTPPDWVLIEAAKRTRRITNIEVLREYYRCAANSDFRVICDMIERYEQPPVDRKLLCAREAYERVVRQPSAKWEEVGVRAIELWESGYGS